MFVYTHFAAASPFMDNIEGCVYFKSICRKNTFGSFKGNGDLQRFVWPFDEPVHLRKAAEAAEDAASAKGSLNSFRLSSLSERAP